MIYDQHYHVSDINCKSDAFTPFKMQNFRMAKNDGNAVWERITITKTLSELGPLAEELGR